MHTNYIIKVLLLFVTSFGSLAILFFKTPEIIYAQSGCPTGSWLNSDPQKFHYSWEKSFFGNVIVKKYYIKSGFNSNQISQIESGFAKWDTVGRSTCMKIGFEQTMDLEEADIIVRSQAD